MRRIALFLMIWPVAAAAVQWELPEGQALHNALAGLTLRYPGGEVQEFYPSGKTLYNAGQDSWGNWRIEGDQYCSQWPPSDLWTCYDVWVDDNLIRFIDANGEFSDGYVVRD